MIIGLILASIVGTTLVTIMMAEAKAVSNRDAWRAARAAGRGSLNLLTTDLSGVETTGGIEYVSPDAKRDDLPRPVRDGTPLPLQPRRLHRQPAPHRFFDLLCARLLRLRVAHGRRLSLSDTAGAALSDNGTASDCTQASVGITTLPAPGATASNAGRVVALTGALSPVPPAGTPFLLYRRVDYAFKASAAVPGAIGLWRTVVETGDSLEIAAPLDTTSRFRFFVGDSGIAQIHGPGESRPTFAAVELVLDGRSEGAPRGAPSPKIFRSRTAIFFLNRPD